ncbi:protein kinase [Legionella lytica]|uniref:Protein kinase n=1 Tax=Legionella lytica TaxID=96232 RepID=A0ABW8D713_9GAMM
MVNIIPSKQAMMFIINPQTLSPEHAKKLSAFFNEQVKKGIHAWSNQRIYSFTEDSYFTFSSNVIMRQPKQGKTGLRYEFISARLLGTGSYGSVYEIEGTLRFDETSFRFKGHDDNGKSRAIKIQRHNDLLSAQKAWKEYCLSQRAPYLALKKPTYEKKSDGLVSYLVMRQFKGRGLDAIIQDDLFGKNVLTLEQRMELTKGLLNALKEQVTDKSLIHRDLKPENILVDMRTQPITVNIIDFGLSTYAEAPDEKYPGTPLYKAPEIWDRQSQSCKSDVFSMARIIAELWRDTTLSTLITLGSHERACTNAHHVSLSTLFTGIDGLDDTTKSIIETTLAGMLQVNSIFRFSIDKAIEHFANSQVMDVAENNTILTRYHPQTMLRIEAILTQTNLLRAHHVDLIKRDSVDAAEKLRQLAATLEHKMHQLKFMSLTNYNLHVEQYIADCQSFINASKEDFAHHRNINYILANIALAIAGLGVVYLAACAVNLAVSRGTNFFFFNETKTSSLVRTVEENLVEMGKLNATGAIPLTLRMAV